MRRFLPLFVLAALPFVGCGGGDGGSGGARVGAKEFAIPFLPEPGETMTLGLKNLSSSTAPVRLTAYSPAGAITPGFTDVSIPAFGEGKVIVNAFFGGFVANGWIHVETRDPATLADLASTGLIVPSFNVQGSGPRGETAPGLLFATSQAGLPIIPETTAVQLINNTRDLATGLVPMPLTATVQFFNTDGTVAGTLMPVLAANEALLLAIPFFGVAGSVVVTAGDVAGDDEKFTLSTKEVPAAQSALTFDYDQELPQQVVDLPEESDVALEFGLAPAGDYRDFTFVLANTRPNPETVTFESIDTEGGGALLLQPELVTLGAFETRVYATTKVNSLGMQLGENHPFFLNDNTVNETPIFGDVFLGVPLERLRFTVRCGQGVAISARNFDPAFQEERTTVPLHPYTHDAIVVGIDQETLLTGAERNYVTLMNPNPTAQDIFVKVFTPMGEEYILPSVTVPAFGRFNYSPDGTVLNGLLGIREDQNDPNAVPVPFYSWRFSSSAGFSLNASHLVLDSQGVYILYADLTVEELDD